MTSSGVSPGLADSMRATTPETTAAACDVPVPLKSPVPRRASGPEKVSMVEPGARSETIETPGASRSGLPPPWLENAAGASSARSAVPAVSAAPTVMTNGSSAGLVTGAEPRFPADTTTTRPARQARWTAAFSGSTAAGCRLSVPHERLTTRMP